MIPQYPVFDQIVLPSPIGNGWRIWWKSEPCASFTLARSTNDGRTFEPLDTVAFNINGANHKNGRFFYDDADGESRYVYALYAVGENGTSKAVLTFAPARNPSTCLVHGYARDMLGEYDPSMRIKAIITNQYVRSEGAVSRNDDGLMLLSGERWFTFDEQGHWQIELPRLARVEISFIPYSCASSSKLFIVPDEEGPINLRDIQPLPQASYLGTWDKSDTPRQEIIHS